MATIDISQLLNAVNNQGASTQSIADTIISDTNNLEQTGQDKIKSISQQADAEIISKQASEAGLLRAQQNTRNAATALGTNMDLASSVINSLGSRMLDNYNQANAALDVIHNKESVGFLDAPLDYISNQISLPQDRENYNYHAQKFNLAEEALARLNAATQSTALTQNAIAEVRTAASLQATTDSIKAKADGLAAEVKQQNLLYNIQGLKTVQDLNMQQVDLLFKTQNALMSEENLNIAKQHLELTRNNMMLSLEARQEKIDANKASMQEIQDMTDITNNGRAALGLPPMNTKTIQQFTKFGGSEKEKLAYQYSIGALQLSVGIPVIAETPGMAAKIITDTQAPLSPAMDPVKKLITSVYSDAATGKIDKSIDTKNQGQVLGLTNRYINLATKSMSGNIKQGDNTNIYQAPDIVSVSTSQSVQESILYQKVLQPAISAGNLTENNPQLIVSLASNAIGKGIISMPEAVQGITNYYTQATLINNKTKNYVRVGILPQSTYITALEDPTGFNNKYDLTNPTMVSNYISKKLAAQRLGISPLNPGVIDFSPLFQ